MTKILKIAACVLFLLILGAAAFFFYALSSIGETLKNVDITEGGAGEFNIGVEKSYLLSKAGIYFSTSLTDANSCATGWVVSPVQNEPNKQCFLNSNEWGAGSPSTYAICPPATDVHTTLFFSGGKLAKINVRCTRPE